MNKAALLFAAASIALAGCGPQAEAPPLANATIGGPFTLTDQDGRRISDTVFDGRYRMIYFGFTFCPDVCPVDLQRLMQGYRLLEKQDAAKAAKIQPIFITVDPARDTPAAIKQFVGAFGPGLIGLTGTPAEIAAVAKKYVIYYKAQPANPDGGYLVDHARQAMLFGPKGEPLALIPQDETPEAIAAELARWTR